MVSTPTDWWDTYREKAQGNHRYHCLNCGRFVRMATVQAEFSNYDPYEWEANGTCGSCGPVEVHWGPM